MLFTFGLRMLQFGHGTDAVEDRNCSALSWRLTPCFNSATALTPWRTSECPERPRRPPALQFGHGTDAVEDKIPNPHKQYPYELQFGHGTDAVEDTACR